jgi:hypothetical protein
LKEEEQALGCNPHHDQEGVRRDSEHQEGAEIVIACGRRKGRFPIDLMQDLLAINHIEIAPAIRVDLHAFVLEHRVEKGTEFRIGCVLISKILQCLV